MRKFLLFLWLSLLPMLANAYDAYIDGIYYNFSENNAIVTYRDFNSNYNSYSGTVVIPEVVAYNGNIYSVTSIGSYAFRNCGGLTSVTIPNCVTSIGYSAFYECSGLTSITIPNSVTSIGSSAFEGCTSLTSVTILNSVTSIGGGAFASCTSLQKVIVSDIAAWCAISFGNDYANPLFYAKHLFSDEETEITNLVIPEGVTSIGKYAFTYCSGLTSITIPNSVTSIGGSAFYGCI